MVTVFGIILQRNTALSECVEANDFKDYFNLILNLYFHPGAD
jgi:hypothetical protein